MKFDNSGKMIVLSNFENNILPEDLKLDLFCDCGGDLLEWRDYAELNE